MKRFIDAMYGQYLPRMNTDDPGGSGGGNGGDEDDGDADKDDPGNRVVTMTQAELDALIGREKGRERKKFADYDELKAERDRLKSEEDARAQAAMTEQQRAEAEAVEAKRRADEAEAARAKALESANRRLINAEFKSAARDLNVRPDALDAALKLADLSGVTVDDEGNVIGAKEAAQTLISASPYLVDKPKPRTIGGGGNEGDERPDKTKEQLLEAAAEKARKSGRVEDRAAYAALKDELSK